MHVAGRVVCLHTSLRAIGQEGDAVIDGFLARGCTLLVPTFSWDAFALPPPSGTIPERNGMGPGPYRATHDRRFTTKSKEIDDDMGVLPRLVLERSEHKRGNNPLVSFTALGPEAAAMVATQSYRDPFAPLRELAARRGVVVLAGVGLTSMTLLHLAEQEAGRAPFVRWAHDASGSPTPALVGGCSDGFDALDDALASGDTDDGWRVYDAAEALASAVAVIRANPRITACSDADCARCRDAVRGRGTPS